MATVYVSSTYSDLKECREHVYRALRQLGHDVRAMEDYVASDKRPLRKCLDDVGGCDIYLGIFAWRYGFVPEEENPEHKSITELELRHAAANGIPTLVFLLNPDAPWPRSSMDAGEESRKIESLRAELSKSKTVSFFDNGESLAVRVNAAVTNQLAERHAQQSPGGWLDRHLEQTERLFTSHMSGVDHLTADQAAARYVELFVEKRPAKPDDKREPERPLADYVKAGARLVVLGEGGSGKTTMLLRLAYEAARKARQDPTTPIPVYAKLNFFDARERSFDELMQTIATSNGLNTADLQALWSDGSRPILLLMDGFNEVRSEFRESCALALEAVMQRRQHAYVITSRPTAQVRQLIERSRADELIVGHLDDRRLAEFLERHGAANLYDQLGAELKELGRNPFLLWALAQSYVGLASTELPRNKGQLYRNLFDRYLFDIHEQGRQPSPTEYNYDLVKKPVLAALAMKMTNDGVTRATRDLELLRGISKQLIDLKQEYEGLVGSGPYTLMPEPASANGVLDEAVLNGVLSVVGNTIEFMHQSVQDYFTAVRMLDWPVAQILELAPPQSFRHAPERSFGFEAIVMLAGLRRVGDELVKAVADVNPLLAAHCLSAASSVSDAVRAELVDRWSRMLRQPNRDYQRLACECLGIAKCARVDVQQELIELAIFGDYNIRSTACDAVLTIQPAFALDYLVNLGLTELCDESSLGEVRDLLSEIDLEEAVVELFGRWKRAEPGTESRRRLEAMLAPASWHESRVRKRLAAIRVDAIRRQDRESSVAAREALDRLAAWQEASPRRVRLTASTIRQHTQSMANLAESVPTLSTAELIAHLQLDNYVAGEVAAEIGRRRLTDALQPLVDVLLRQNIDKNVEPMVKAIEQIDRAQGVQLLRAALQESGPDDTRAAVALGLFGELDALPLVERAVSCENQAFRRAAARVLSAVGTDSAVEALRDALSAEDDEEVCSDLVRAVGQVKTRAAAGVLADVLLRKQFDRLFGDEGGPRDVARAALFEAVGPHELTSVLRQAARDESGSTRRSAVMEMLALEAVPLDLPDVLRHAWHDPEGRVRAVALGGLLHTAPPLERRTLMNEALQDREAQVRTIALRGWQDVDPNGAQAGWLASALSDPDSSVRREAAAMLRGMFEPAVEELSRVLEGGSAEARLAAIEALTTLGSSSDHDNGAGAPPDSIRDKIVASLRRALSDGDARVRVAATEAIGGVQADSAVIIPTLVDIAWHDQNVSVRQAAAARLSDIDGGRIAMLKPIWDRLDKGGDPRDVVKLIGEEQPFLPDDGYLYALRGELLAQLRELDKAQADYENARQRQFDDPWLRINQAKLFAERELYGEATERARAVLELEPDNAEAYANLGWYSYKTGNLQAAIDESRIALELDPTLAMAALNLGLACLAADRPAEARAAYAKARDLCAAMTPENKSATLQAALADLDELLKAKPETAATAGEFKTTLAAVSATSV